MGDKIKADRTGGTQTPFECELDDLQTRTNRPPYYHDPYYAWRRGADNDMPTRPTPPSKIELLFRSCCCGSGWGILAWILGILLLGAGVTALIVKAVLPHNQTTVSRSNASTLLSTTTITATELSFSALVSTEIGTSVLTTSVISTATTTLISPSMTIVTSVSTYSPPQASTVTISATTTQETTVSERSSDQPTIIISINNNKPNITSDLPSKQDSPTLSNPVTESSLTQSVQTSTSSESNPLRSTVYHVGILPVYVHHTMPAPTYSGYPESMSNLYVLEGHIRDAAALHGIDIPLNSELSPDMISKLAAYSEISSLLAAYQAVASWCNYPPVRTDDSYYTLICRLSQNKRAAMNSLLPMQTGKVAHAISG